MNRSLAGMIVLVFLALAAGAGLLAARSLRIDTNTNDLISSDLPFQQNRIHFDALFPRTKTPLIAVIDAQTPERAEWAADVLAERLAHEPDRFDEAYRPDGGAFFARNGLLFLSTDELERLSTRLADAQPFLGRLVRDPSVRGLAGLLSEALDRSIDAPEETLARLLRALAETIPEPRGGIVRELSWRRTVANDPDDPETTDTQRVVQLRPRLDRTRLGSKAAAMGAVRDAAQSLGLAGYGVRVRMTGTVALQRDELGTVIRGMEFAGPVSAVLVALLLFLAMRSYALVNASLITLAVGLSLTLGFATLAVGRLNLISIAFGVLYVGLGADFAIHLALNIRARRAEGFDPAGALRGAVRDVSGSLSLCALTTTAGFYVFLPTSFVGVSELGLIAGTGIIISLVTTLLLLPALMAILPSRWKKPPVARPAGLLLRALHAPERHRAPVLIGAALVALGSLALLPRARFDPDPLSLRNPKSESVRTLRDLRQTHGSDHWSVSALAKTDEDAGALRDRLALLPVVDKTVWVGSFIPKDQDEKLALIDDLSLMMGPTLDPPDAPPATPTFDETIASLRGLIGALTHATENAETPPAIRAEAGVLRNALDEWVARTANAEQDAAATAVDRLCAAWLGSFSLMLNHLRATLDPEPVTRDTLPAALSERWVAANGEHRVEAFPRTDLSDSAEMRAFITAVRRVAGNIVGPPVSYIQSGDTVVRAFTEALSLAFLAIVIITLIAFRSALTMLEVITPFAIGGVATVGAMVLLNQPFNFANVIALPLLLGVGIDSGIHLVHRSKAGAHDRLLESATARGVLFSALTTIAGFGSLAFSPHPGMASMGLVLSVGMVSMLASTLIVLPALLTFRAPALKNEASSIKSAA